MLEACVATHQRARKELQHNVAIAALEGRAYSRICRPTICLLGSLCPNKRRSICPRSSRLGGAHAMSHM